MVLTGQFSLVRDYLIGQLFMGTCNPFSGACVWCHFAYPSPEQAASVGNEPWSSEGVWLYFVDQGWTMAESDVKMSQGIGSFPQRPHPLIPQPSPILSYSQHCRLRIQTPRRRKYELEEVGRSSWSGCDNTLPGDNYRETPHATYYLGCRVGLAGQGLIIPTWRRLSTTYWRRVWHVMATI